MMRYFDTWGSNKINCIPLPRSNNIEVKYFVYNHEIFDILKIPHIDFDILKTAHIQIGHGGLYKVYEVVKHKYPNSNV